MEKVSPNRLFQVAAGDNVVTALTDVEPGTVEILGECNSAGIKAVEKVPNGHKMAVIPIKNGESIIKYGIPIGRATRDIAVGEWVHLHNMESMYDSRAAHLDARTGVPTDMKYE